MYGMFYLTKNNITHVILLFQLRENTAKQFSEMKIYDWESIKSFDKNIKLQMKKIVEEKFQQPYHVYYRNIPDDSSLRKTMKELNLKSEDLRKPLLEVSNLDLDIDNLLKISPNKYDKHDISRLWDGKI